MKIEILVGSPRKNGNTFALTNHLNELLNRNTECSHLSFLYDYKIQPCIDCRSCKSGNMNCTVKDDTRFIFNKIEDADVVVMGTPIYWFGPTAKTKLLIDRFRPYFINKKLKGKKGAIILSAGSGIPDCDLTIEMFRRVFDSLEVDYLDTVAIKAYDIGDAAKNKSGLKKISALSEKIRGK
jgi:multimeric flavodoxin WrbA